MKHSLLLAALLAVALSACGQKEATVVTPPTPVIAEPSPAVVVAAPPAVAPVDPGTPAAAAKPATPENPTVAPETSSKLK